MSEECEPRVVATLSSPSLATVPSFVCFTQFRKYICASGNDGRSASAAKQLSLGRVLNQPGSSNVNQLIQVYVDCKDALTDAEDKWRQHTRTYCIWMVATSAGEHCDRILQLRNNRAPVVTYSSEFQHFCGHSRDNYFCN